MSNGRQVATRASTLQAFLTSDATQVKLAEAMEGIMDPMRVAKLACLAIQKSRKLAACTQASIYEALLTASQLGLEPDGRNAYLVPYKEKCQLLPSYMGLIALASQDPKVLGFSAEAVCKNDDFDYQYGTDEFLRHKLARGDRGDDIGAWAMCRMTKGPAMFMFMSVEEILRRRDAAQASEIWDKWPKEMAIKTVIKRFTKRLPIGGRFADALRHDNAIDVESIDVSADRGRRRRRLAPVDADTSDVLALAERPGADDVTVEYGPDGREIAAVPPAAAEPPEPAPASEAKTKRKRVKEAARATDERPMIFSVAQSEELKQATDRGGMSFDDYIEISADARKRFVADSEQTIDAAFRELKLRLLATGDKKPARADQIETMDALLASMGTARAEYEAKALAEYKLPWNDINIAQAEHFIKGLRAASKGTKGKLS